MDQNKFKDLVNKHIKAPTTEDGAFISLPYIVECDWCEQPISSEIHKHFKRRDIDSKTWQGKCDCGKECRFKMKKK
jgi:hypothetical protein